MRFAVIAMGRFGGGELGYSSDADVMFVHEPLDGGDEREATDAAFAVANELRRLLMVPSPDPPLEIDADLRPEGKQGPLVRSLASYASYYQRWSSTWERQALIRARFVAGDETTGTRLMSVVDSVRWGDPLTDDEAREIRRLKARMEAERLPRGADPTLHTKLGRGGLSDVEWTVQLLQLRYAHGVPALRTPHTLEALRVLSDEGLLTEEDADVLRTAWLMATRVRNLTMLASGRASDMVPTDARGLTGVGHLLGYPPGHSGQLLEEYQRVTRRARGVVERVFYE
jgi:glutamate-ammonia-ligase adenylyltransferase